MIVDAYMIYTCYEMIRDCRAGRAEGWRYFISTYVPVIRKSLAHYHAGAPRSTTGAIAVHSHTGIASFPIAGTGPGALVRGATAADSCWRNYRRRALSPRRSISRRFSEALAPLTTGGKTGGLARRHALFSRTDGRRSCGWRQPPRRRFPTGDRPDPRQGGFLEPDHSR